MPFDHNAMRAARAAMLQAVIAAFFVDACADGAETITLEVDRDAEGNVSIDIEHLVGGVPVLGYSL
jgi:hypothetical protein